MNHWSHPCGDPGATHVRVEGPPLTYSALVQQLSYDPEDILYKLVPCLYAILALLRCPCCVTLLCYPCCAATLLCCPWLRCPCCTDLLRCPAALACCADLLCCSCHAAPAMLHCCAVPVVLPLLCCPCCATPAVLPLLCYLVLFECFNQATLRGA